MDIRREGTVRYVAIERGSTASGDMIMDEVTTHVNEQFIADGEPDFQSTWLLVAQWDGVHPHPHGADDREGIDEEYLNRVCESNNCSVSVRIYAHNYLKLKHN